MTQRVEFVGITAEVVRWGHNIRVYFMKQTTRMLPFLLFFLLVHNTALSENQSVLFSQFHRIFYEQMGDQLYKTKELPESLKKAIAAYKKALKYGPAETEIYWKITRCYWVLATKQTENPEERERFFKKGIHFGEQAISNSSNNPNAYLWYALIMGSHSVNQGVMNTIYMRNRIKENLESAIRLNPKNANAVLGLSGWYFHVPGFFGGDKKKAIELIDLAIRIDPCYSAVLIQKAEFLIRMKKYQNAAKTLKRLLQLKKATFQNDTREDKARARFLLEDLEKKKYI